MPLDIIRPFDVKRHPFTCLTLTIQGLKDTFEGLRPKEELEKVLGEYDDNTIHQNPL